MDLRVFFDVLINVFGYSFCYSIVKHFDHEVKPVQVHHLESDYHQIGIHVTINGERPKDYTFIQAK